MSSPPLPCTPSRSRDRVRITMRVIVSASASRVNPCSTDHPRTMNAEIPRHTAYEALTTANQPGVRNNPARTTSGAYMDQATLRGQATMQASRTQPPTTNPNARTGWRACNTTRRRAGHVGQF